MLTKEKQQAIQDGTIPAPVKKLKLKTIPPLTVMYNNLTLIEKGLAKARAREKAPGLELAIARIIKAKQALRALL